MSAIDMAIQEVPEEATPSDIEDELNDFMADLLAERRNEPFLQALFLTKPGSWVEASMLCRDLEATKHRLNLLQEASNDSLFATWLAYPDMVNSDGFCIITFFAPMLMWSNTAIYNQAHLLHNSRQNGIHR